MISKQDRQGVRTPADLERKYRFDDDFVQQGTRIGQLEQEFRLYETQTNATMIGFLEDIAGFEQEVEALKEVNQEQDTKIQELEGSSGSGIVSIEITEV